jgi:hypothetical protein
MGAASCPAVSYLVSFSYLLLYGLMQVREGNTQHGSVTLDILGAVPLLAIGRIVEYEVRRRRRERHRRDARAWHGGNLRTTMLRAYDRDDMSGILQRLG